jgi:hypothetical protein
MEKLNLKRKKSLFKSLFMGFLMTAFFMLSTLCANAYDFMMNGIYYGFITGTNHVEVTNSGESPNLYKNDMVIPSSVSWKGKDYQVTAIGDYAFQGCQIKTIVLPSTLTSIGYAAFELSQIKSVTIPASVDTISSWAFTKCPYLENIVFEGSVTIMGEHIFAGYSQAPRYYTIEVKCEPFEIMNSLGLVDLEKSVLIVPDGMKNHFLAVAGWQSFGTIIEKSHTSNINPAKETNITVYLSGNTLSIDSPANEIVQIYSVSGRLLLYVTKPAGKVDISVSSLREDLLIVTGSLGWVKKVIWR